MAADHSHFILTVDVPNHASRPSRYIAQMLREAAAMVETQVVLNKQQGVRDAYGDWKYGWEMEASEAPPETRKMTRRVLPKPAPPLSR